MAQLAEICYPRRKAGQAERRLRSLARRRRPMDLGLAEDLLREMAFVYRAARTIRESMAEEMEDRG